MTPSRCQTGEGAKMASGPSSLCGLGLQLTSEEMTRKYQATSGNSVIWSISGRKDLILTWGAWFVCVNEHGLISQARIREPAETYTTKSLSSFLVNLYCQALPFKSSYTNVHLLLLNGELPLIFKSSQCEICVINMYKYLLTYISPYIICCHSRWVLKVSRQLIIARHVSVTFMLMSCLEELDFHTLYVLTELDTQNTGDNPWIAPAYSLKHLVVPLKLVISF